MRFPLVRFVCRDWGEDAGVHPGTDAGATTDAGTDGGTSTDGGFDAGVQMWTWVSGTSSVNVSGNYGTRGVAASTNVPGGRDVAASWIDRSGNVWIFGGFGWAGGTQGYLNDLWKFDGTNWTWVSGSSTVNQPGDYGTKGVAAASNAPGGRTVAASWIDAAGNFWLFGGNGYGATASGLLNDLWKFDGTSWTWISGSSANGQAGSYGTKGVAASTNFPGGRNGSALWIDGAGVIWLFGGAGSDNTGTTGRLNDLWKFDGSNWTWISGSSTRSQLGNYGTKDIAAASNIPGARAPAAWWKGAAGSLWLFGGSGYDAATFGNLNDLWKWDGSSWTWISGGSSIGQLGTYGTRGVASSVNVPGSRDLSTGWTDSAGNLWLFGGYLTGGAVPTSFNDLWRFDGANWTWISGSSLTNQSGVYGTKGLAAASNVPGARGQPTSWVDDTGNVWLFGGVGYAGSSGRLNDLWKWR